MVKKGVVNMNIGDKVKITITEKELNEILKENKDLEEEILECYNKQVGTIVDKFLPGSLFEEMYYCLDIDDNIAWKESELKSIDWE